MISRITKVRWWWLLPALWLGGFCFARQPDAFDSLVNSAASFDMDSPVEARAEFDPPVAVLGGRVVYRIEVSALDESLTVPDKLPSPPGLDFHLGGRGQTYQPSPNMKLRPKTTVIYRTMVTNLGTFTMPAFEITAYGKPVEVPSATLTVVNPGEGAQRESARLNLVLPKGDCYVGQSVKIRLELPAAGDGSVMGLTQPHITADYIFAEQAAFGMRQESIQRDGRTFNAYVQEVTITPLRAGPQELLGQANTYTFRREGSPSSPMRSTTMLVDSEPVTLNVKALPTEGILPGFTGAVGRFHIEPPILSSTQVHAGEPVSLTLQIHGEGSLGRLSPPPLPVLHNWQGFPPSPDSTPSSAIQQRGFAVFKYTLIPLSDVIHYTPEIPFSYFDPQRGVYVDLTIPAVPIRVLPGAVDSVASLPILVATNSQPDESAKDEPDLKLSGLALKPGATAASLRPVELTRSFWAFQLLPAGLLGGLWAWERRRRYLAKHPEVILRRRARRGVRRELRLARRAASEHDARGFVTRTANALCEACAPHSAATPGALVCADVLNELPAAERLDQPGQIIRRVFAAADAARFGGAIGNEEDLLALQPAVEQVLDEMKARL